MAETIFAKIIRDELPSYKVYEDNHTLAFLDLHPLSEGHTLLIPKVPVATLDQLSDEASAAIGRVLPRLCRAILKATGAKAYNVLQNNGSEAYQSVFHVHFHIIPRFPERATGGGLGLNWEPQPLQIKLAEPLAQSIRLEATRK